MQYVIGFVVALTLGIVGCADDCSRQLGDYGCISRSSCPTYDELLKLEGIEAIPCADTEFIVYARDLDGGGSVLYFDESGTIVAAESFGYGFDSCGGQILYGPVPSCPQEQWWRNSYVF